MSDTARRSGPRSRRRRCGSPPCSSSTSRHALHRRYLTGGGGSRVMIAGRVGLCVRARVRMACRRRRRWPRAPHPSRAVRIDTAIASAATRAPAAAVSSASVNARIPALMPIATRRRRRASGRRARRDAVPSTRALGGDLTPDRRHRDGALLLVSYIRLDFSVVLKIDPSFVRRRRLAAADRLPQLLVGHLAAFCRRRRPSDGVQSDLADHPREPSASKLHAAHLRPPPPRG